MATKKSSKESNIELKARIGLTPFIEGTIGSKWTKDEKGIGVSPLSGEEIYLLPGDDFNVARPIIGMLTGFSSQEIKKLGLYVDISIRTDAWYPQGRAIVQPNGEWVLETARFGGVAHLVKMVLKDKDDKELSSSHFTVTVKRQEGQLRLDGSAADPKQGIPPVQKKLKGYFQIVAKHSGKCLDVDGASQENCAKVIQYYLHGGDSQLWTFVEAADGFYHIFAKHSGKCLDVDGGKTDDSASVWQYAFHGGDNQKWELRDAGNGYFHIIAKHSGKALDVNSYNMNDGATIFQFALHGGDNQQWKLLPTDQK